MVSFYLESLLKVSKSQKHYLEFSILPKNKQRMEKKYPVSSQNIYFFFIHFLEELRITKIVLEIY
jgi:hypothetical protein